MSFLVLRHLTKLHSAISWKTSQVHNYIENAFVKSQSICILAILFCFYKKLIMEKYSSINFEDNIMCQKNVSAKTTAMNPAKSADKYFLQSHLFKT